MRSRRPHICLGWAETAARCTNRPMGERRNPWLCDDCDREREADLHAQLDRLREEVRQR
jgi:hypothetical protein